MKKLLTLWRVLWSGEETARDERTKEELRSTWLLVLGVGCLLLLGVTVYYLMRQDVNRSQLAAGITGIVALLAGGLGLSCCFRGILNVADRWSGRLVVLAGVLSMAVHWGMLVPIRQYFQSSIFFVDFLLLGAVLFYLLCNGAYCAYETMWREREAAQEAADTAEMEDADLLEQRALRSFRKKRTICVILFLAAVAVPALLQIIVFSDRVMGQAQQQYEISE